VSALLGDDVLGELRCARTPGDDVLIYIYMMGYGSHGTVGSVLNKRGGRATSRKEKKGSVHIDELWKEQRARIKVG